MEEHLLKAFVGALVVAGLWKPYFEYRNYFKSRGLPLDWGVGRSKQQLIKHGRG